MPVEIKELVIRAVAEPVAPPAATPERSARPSQGQPTPLTREHREAIVQECVKRVLRVLEKSRER